jgi:hypothetical protein
MKKCFIYGNCQTKPIRDFLNMNSDFLSTYESSYLECFLLSENDVPNLEKLASEADLFIYQPVSEDYKAIGRLSTHHLKTLLKRGCQVIAIPVAYFTGYNPEAIYLGSEFEGPFITHDRNILMLYSQGKSVQETANLIQSLDFYQSIYVENNVEATLNQLKRREPDLDVKLTEFIRSNYKKARLFHTMNHPSSIVIAYVANSILNLLGIKSERDALANFYRFEVLDYLYFPIYPSVAHHLKLSFPCQPQYYFNGVFSIKDAIEKFFIFYDQNPEAVERGFSKITQTPRNKLATEADIDCCYRLLLKREPDAHGRAYWINRIVSEAISAKSLAIAFMNSQEFESRYRDHQLYLENNVVIRQYINFFYRLLPHQHLEQKDSDYWVRRICNEKMSIKTFLSIAILDAL